MSTDAAQRPSNSRWKPHPDDEAELREAITAAERGELLSPEASEAFLRWLEGNGDDSWREGLV